MVQRKQLFLLFKQMIPLLNNLLPADAQVRKKRVNVSSQSCSNFPFERAYPGIDSGAHRGMLLLLGQPQIEF